MVYEQTKDWPKKYDINKLMSRQNDIDKNNQRRKNFCEA